MFALNRRLLIVLLASFAPLTVWAQNAEDSLIDYLDVSEAVEIAVQDNPNLAEVNTRYQALSEIPSQVGTLPDPVLNFNVMNLPTDTFDRAQEPMTQVQFGFSQSFPFPGKLGLREDAAEHDARAAGHSVDEVRLQLVQKVKSKWWLLYYLDRALETVDNNQALLRQFIAVARTKYETGKGLQQDVLLAQLELSKLLDQEIQLNAIRQNQATGLNILMDRLPSVPIDIASRVSKAMPELADESVLFNQAALARPLLKQKKTMVEAARSRLNLAKRDYYPDFTVGMAYGDRTGANPMPRGGARADFLSLMLGIKIPLYAGRKQSKAVSQRQLEVQTNRYALLDERSLVLAAIAVAATDYRQAKEQFSLYESGIVPQARQTVESMLAGYQVSEVDFLNLVRSQLTLLNYELQYWKSLSEAKRALARLEAAVGEESVYE